MSLILCGHSGCGKTTLGRAYAQQFGYSFVDTDQVMLSNATANAIGALYQALGEAEFREQERRVVSELSQTATQVIATGGGVMMDSKCAATLKSLGCVVYLKAPETLLWQRIMERDQFPKFLSHTNPREDFARYYAQRCSQYERVADATVKIEQQSIEALVEILHQLRGEHGE